MFRSHTLDYSLYFTGASMNYSSPVTSPSTSRSALEDKNYVARQNFIKSVLKREKEPGAPDSPMTPARQKYIQSIVKKEREQGNLDSPRTPVSNLMPSGTSSVHFPSMFSTSPHSNPFLFFPLLSHLQ